MQFTKQISSGKIFYSLYLFYIFMLRINIFWHQYISFYIISKAQQLKYDFKKFTHLTIC